MQFLSAIVAGLAVGSIYALLALAITVVFSVRRVVNFAQGDLVMAAGLVGATAITAWGLPYIAGLILAGAAVAALSILIDRVAIKPLAGDESNIAWILSIVAVAIILGNAGTLIWGTEPQTFPSLLSSRPVNVAGLRIVPDHLAAIGGAIAIMVGFHLLQTRTMLGRSMRAVARDSAMAQLLGISVSRSVTIALAISGGMAAVAGFLIGPITFVSAGLGFALGIKGFAAAALGGLGSFRGAAAGGMILGVAETLAVSVIGSALKDSVALVILCLILVVKPTGLFGEAPVAKV